MKRCLSIFCCLLPLAASAHIGSPNVFFEGRAGAHPLRVVIRPPAVLPGIAQVDARLGVGGVTNVLVQAVLFEAGNDAAPDPVQAVAVPGETNLFNAALWLLREGSYSVRITVESPLGRGLAIVPLNSAATMRPVMSPLLVMALLALGGGLAGAVVWLAGAAARDWSLERGALSTGRDEARGRIVASVTAVLVAGTICSGKIRWQTIDRDFRNNALYKPLPVAATVRTNGNLRLLRLTPPEEASGAPAWDTLAADHGKLMHLFLLREPLFDAFAHLHPVRRDNRTFENVLPFLPAGTYQLYAEITHDNGLSQTLTTRIAMGDAASRAPQLTTGTNMLNEVFCQSATVPANGAPQPFALDADDSWHTSAPPPAGRSSQPEASPLMGGGKMVFQNARELVENQETSLRFAVFDADGKTVPLQLYMGMLGHAVVRRSGGEVFTHLHPLGTISMAAQELFARGANSDAAPPNRSTEPTGGSNARPNNEVAFPYAFPRSGDYRVWVQVRTGGRVLTGVFDTSVKPTRRG